MKEKRNKGDIFITLWITLGVVIVLGYFVFSFIIGGSAANGYQLDGQFFVCAHSDGVAVSKVVWMISKVWGVLFSIFIPLTPIGAFVISKILEKMERRKNRFE
ncbi:MAG: hypothetical protein IJ426_07180 [Clostridia bacterium]|nr:hypothetical protein [Clostridia bacterium]